MLCFMCANIKSCLFLKVIVVYKRNPLGSIWPAQNRIHTNSLKTAGSNNNSWDIFSPFVLQHSCGKWAIFGPFHFFFFFLLVQLEGNTTPSFKNTDFDRHYKNAKLNKLVFLYEISFFFLAHWQICLAHLILKKQDDNFCFSRKYFLV